MNTTDELFRSLTVRDIDFLRDEQCLYSIDFRATGESLDMKIKAMFKYENLTRWLGGIDDETPRRIVVNETFPEDSTPSFVTHIAPRQLEMANVSIYDRLAPAPEGVTSLWVGVPHPSADRYAERHGLTLNYSYASFLERNDKLRQKQLLSDITPSWRQFSDQADFMKTIQSDDDVFLKKRYGAGGYGVLSLRRSDPTVIQKTLQDATFDEWYVEERAPGEPWSVQCLKDTAGRVTVFGSSQQHIEDETVYAGARLEDITALPETLRSQVADALTRLSPLLDAYVGFFGIDFMLDGETIQVLECNVRLTAASLPTLLCNSVGVKTAGVYREDVSRAEAGSDDVILVTDDIYETNDVVQFQHLDDRAVGYSCFIQLSAAAALPAAVDETSLADLKRLVSESVSDVISVSYHNFWPYGWTVSMILTESHCVLSSWHQERNILVDVFCCKQFDHYSFAERLADHFQATNSIDELKERYLI